MPYPLERFLEIYEDMVQILLMLGLLVTLDFEVEDLFRGTSSQSEPFLYFCNYLVGFGLSLFKMTLSMNLLE